MVNDECYATEPIRIYDTHMIELLSMVNIVSICICSFHRSLVNRLCMKHLYRDSGTVYIWLCIFARLNDMMIYV